MKFDFKRKYEVSIVVESNSQQEARQSIESLGLKVNEVRLLDNHRTDQQNRALHKFFSLLADELNEKGLDMRTLIRQKIEIQWTPYNVKEYLWKPLQKQLTGKESTKKLDKTEEINLIYNNLNRILIERTKGEVKFPSFPSIETQNYD